MSGPPVIEPAKFARGHERLVGTLAASALPRVVDLLFDSADAGTIRYVVAGTLSERGYPALHIELDGDLNLRCQRCLGALAQRVHAQRDIVLVPGADEFAQREDEGESEDMIPDVARLDLAALLEEELILALPLAVRHEEGACRSDALEASAPPAASPFDVLARLKR